MNFLQWCLIDPDDETPMDVYTTSGKVYPHGKPVPAERVASLKQMPLVRIPVKVDDVWQVYLQD